MWPPLAVTHPRLPSKKVLLIFSFFLYSWVTFTSSFSSLLNCYVLLLFICFQLNRKKQTHTFIHIKTKFLKVIGKSFVVGVVAAVFYCVVVVFFLLLFVRLLLNLNMNYFHTYIYLVLPSTTRFVSGCLMFMLMTRMLLLLLLVFFIIVVVVRIVCLLTLSL